MSESDTQIVLELADRIIVLIGTAHISKESIEEVSRFIREERPSMVCVEIDNARYDAMTGHDNWKKLDIIKVIREGKGFLLIANLVLSSFQRRLGSALGVKPGSEMKSAIDTAQEMGIPFSFCDRDVQITLRRAWGRCGFWSKCKLLSMLFSSAFTNEKLSEEEIENLKKNTELDGMMHELSNFLPEVKKTLIDERDMFLAAKIWENSSGRAKTAAVVGAGHLNGIKAHIESFAKNESGENTNIDTSDLESSPAQGGFSKIAGWIIPGFIVLFAAVGFFRADINEVSAELLKWLLWNGSLAALGALIAFAHPLAILVSFFGAPVGTLSPFISVGLFSALAQAYMKRPQIEDAETLAEDATNIKGIYRNRITHILLVFFLASIGGMIGNFISVASIASVFAKYF